MICSGPSACSTCAWIAVDMIREACSRMEKPHAVCSRAYIDEIMLCKPSSPPAV